MAIAAPPTPCASGLGIGDSSALHGVEAQLAEFQHALSRLQDGLCWYADQWDQTWKTEAELRAEGDQEVEKLLSRAIENQMDAAEQKISQVSTSLESLAGLQMKLGSEAKIRQEADGRLQMFLRDFRGHVVGEVEELWTRHRQLSAGVDLLRGLVGQVVELVEMRTSSQSEGQKDQQIPLSARVNGSDELASLSVPTAEVAKFQEEAVDDALAAVKAA